MERDLSTESQDPDFSPSQALENSEDTTLYTAFNEESGTVTEDLSQNYDSLPLQNDSENTQQEDDQFKDITVATIGQEDLITDTNSEDQHLQQISVDNQQQSYTMENSDEVTESEQEAALEVLAENLFQQQPRSRYTGRINEFLQFPRSSEGGNSLSQLDQYFNYPSQTRQIRKKQLERCRQLPVKLDPIDCDITQDIMSRTRPTDPQTQFLLTSKQNYKNEFTDESQVQQQDENTNDSDLLEQSKRPSGVSFKEKCKSISSKEIPVFERVLRSFSRRQSLSEEQQPLKKNKNEKKGKFAKNLLIDQSDSNIKQNQSNIKIDSNNNRVQYYDGISSVNTLKLLDMRESLANKHIGFSNNQKCHFLANKYLPKKPQSLIDFEDEDYSQIYIGRYSFSGDYFIAGFKDLQQIRVYDVNDKNNLVKDIQARNIRWTITDVAMSPDQRFLLYSSLDPLVHQVNIGGVGGDQVQSIQNVTEIHEGHQFEVSNNDDDNDILHSYAMSQCVWSLDWSLDGIHVVAGTRDHVICYDMNQKRVIGSLRAHSNDINATRFVDQDQRSVVVSGSDDSLMQLWDLRLPASFRGQSQGHFIGHNDGITHLDSKKDGRYLISNSKDQTIKLWDLRKLTTNKQVIQQAKNLQNPGRINFEWDYRGESYPGAKYEIVHKDDTSLMTYRGHKVQRTLIRAYFSPQFSTGQKYVYSGSADGKVYMWDLITGELVQVLKYHHGVIRDLDWHPYIPQLTTVSLDGQIVNWGPQQSRRRKLQEINNSRMGRRRLYRYRNRSFQNDTFSDSDSDSNNEASNSDSEK